MSIRSMTPGNSSAPHRNLHGSGVTPSFSWICSITFSGLAPVRSILLMNAIRGIDNASSAGRRSATGSARRRRHTARGSPRRGRGGRSTSTVKSTCPGVSMMLMVVVPFDLGRGGGNGDTPLALELHEVHRRAAVAPLDLLHAVNTAAIVENPLSQGGLPRIDVGGDSDVPMVGQAFHKTTSIKWTAKSELGVFRSHPWRRNQPRKKIDQESRGGLKPHGTPTKSKSTMPSPCHRNPLIATPGGLGWTGLVDVTSYSPG